MHIKRIINDKVQCTQAINSIQKNNQAIIAILLKCLCTKNQTFNIFMNWFANVQYY